MKRAVRALIVTVLAGIAGIYVGAFLNLEGYLGIILAIAVMGFFIILEIKEKK